MAVASSSNGSQTATITTEHSLAAPTTAGVYQAKIDLSAMENGTTPDILEVRIYTKARTSDTKRLAMLHVIVGVPTCQIFVSPIYATPHYFEVSIKQTQGTGRAYPWEVDTL